MQPCSLRSAALFLGVAALSIRSLAGQAPLVELTFGNGLLNRGSLGGEGIIESYAPGEGPVIGLGRTGLGFCQATPSRAGGPGQSPAGGSVCFMDPGINDLPEVTLSLWFQPYGSNQIARLLYYSNQWDVYLSESRLAFNVRHGGQDHHHVVEADQVLARDREWSFLALTHDRVRGVATLYHAWPGEPVRRVTEWTDIPIPDSGEGSLQIGNLGKIRPFRGGIDSVRIYGQILSEGEIAALAAAEDGLLMHLETSAIDRPVPPPIFGHGDVLLSSRSVRPTSIETVSVFRPDRLMWSYSTDAAFIRACREQGVSTFQGCINSIAGPTEPDAQALDFDGNPVVAPWMVAFDRERPWYWGCNNRPRFLEFSLERAATALAAGADWLQFDDWAMVVSAHAWGGACFCDACMDAFRAYLQADVSPEERNELALGPLDAFDYREHLRQREGVADASDYRERRQRLPMTRYFDDFQRVSVRRFFTDFRRRLDARSGRRVPVSLNATLRQPGQAANYAVDIVDFLQGETWDMGLVDLAVPAKTAEALGTWQLFVPKPVDLRIARRAIAASYALGQLMLVPWDMYMGSDATGVRPRYYGTPEQYGDLFAFVRERRVLFDRAETCAFAAVVIDLDRPDIGRIGALCERLFRRHVPFSFAPVGSSYYPARLDPERLRRLRLVLTACDADALERDTRDILDRLREDLPVLSDHEATDDLLNQVSPLDIWGPRGLVVVPRAPRDPASKRLALHVLNRTDLDRVAWTSIILRKGALAAGVAGAMWHAPGIEPAALDIERHAEGLRLLIPSLDMWGIIELSLD